MNSLYPDSGHAKGGTMLMVTPDAKQTLAEIAYLVEVFRRNRESLQKTGRALEENVPHDFQPDLPDSFKLPSTLRHVQAVEVNERGLDSSIRDDRQGVALRETTGWS
jgi:hypothetical protein